MVFGYLTPKLIDQFSKGEPRRASYSYTINIVGSILGPLAAGYLLLPFLGARVTLIVFALPVIGFALLYLPTLDLSRPLRFTLVPAYAVSIWVCAALIFNHEDGRQYENYEVHRDYAATVIAHGQEFDKMLLVNGHGMTQLTTISKFMAHLPLVFHAGEPKSAAVICFGMGTTFRSLLKWNLEEVKAIELIPSVVKAFPFFHPDASDVLADPRGKVVIDDGRRYMNRIDENFDVITLDPPPPIEAAGSSLLYSKEFLEIVKSRLKPGGVVQHWFPGGETEVLESIVKAIREVYPHVAIFHSIRNWGFHILASEQAIPELTGEDMMAKLPQEVREDIMEWEPGLDIKQGTIADVMNKMVSHRLSAESLVEDSEMILLSDNHPTNEYYLLRRTWNRLRGRYTESQ
jgi:spermidine synthase